MKPKKEDSATQPSTSNEDDSGSGGGGGGGGGDDDDGTPPAQTSQDNFRVIFVTTSEVDGTGNTTGTGSGLTSFDALCETERVAKGLGGQYKALIHVDSARTLDTDWVLREGKEYRREDLTTVIGTAESTLGVGVRLYPTPLENAFTATAKYPWTGMNEDWTSATMNCSNWSVGINDGTNLGAYGKSSVTAEFVDLGYTSYWGGPFFYNADVAQVTCDALHPIYCVQTRQPPLTGTQKILFRSTTTLQGNAGLAGFDAACAADATSKGLSGTYKAVIGARDPNDINPTPAIIRGPCTSAACASATGMSEAVDWPLLPETVYVDEARSFFYSKTNDHGIFEGELEETLPVADTWTGLGNTWIPSVLDNCLDWTSNNSGADGHFGDGTSLNSGNAIGSQVTACNGSKHVLCAEQ